MNRPDIEHQDHAGVDAADRHTEAQRAADGLKDQIAAIRARVREARRALSGERDSEG